MEGFNKLLRILHVFLEVEDFFEVLDSGCLEDQPAKVLCASFELLSGHVVPVGFNLLLNSGC